MILLDTNILARLADAKDVQYQTTHNAVRKHLHDRHRLVIARQSLHEFWAVATRPIKKNGLEMQTTTVDRFVTRFLKIFRLVDDPPDLFDQWRSLVNRLNIKGLQSYDARLAAFAISMGYRGVMTYNLDDFVSFPVHIVDPNNPATW